MNKFTNHSWKRKYFLFIKNMKTSSYSFFFYIFLLLTAYREQHEAVLQFSCLLKRAVFTAPNTQRHLRAGRKLLGGLADHTDPARSKQILKPCLPGFLFWWQLAIDLPCVCLPYIWGDVWELFQVSSSQTTKPWT